MTDFESKPPSTGLWKSNSDRGPIATGNCGSIRFVLWANDKRGNDKAPDYRLVMEAAQKREADTSGAPAGGGGMPDDSIPFAAEFR